MKKELASFFFLLLFTHVILAGAGTFSYPRTSGVTLTGADGITLTGADGMTLAGPSGITLTGADGTRYYADSVTVDRPDGITLTGADGITLMGADGLQFIGDDGITLTGADGITLTGADGITLTGADSITGIGPNGVLFELSRPTGITLTGADGITLTGADGITIVGIQGGLDFIGLQSIDPSLSNLLDNLTDDSNVNAVVVFTAALTNADLKALRSIGILGGTRFRKLPFVYVTATKRQLRAVAALPQVRSIYGNRTLDLDSDPYFNLTQVQRVAGDANLRSFNSGMPVTGRGVTVAVLDTGINGLHPDLAGRMSQNLKLVDLQSVPAGFTYPLPLKNLVTTDLVAGHGSFVAGIVAGTGTASRSKYAGVAPGAKLLGLSAGDLSLIHVLSGFDYILDKGGKLNVRVVNCSFSADVDYDPHDPVNIATKMLTDAGVSVVVSAGNDAVNPYAMAPWVISVGATDRYGDLATFSARGNPSDGADFPTLVAPAVNVASIRSVISTTSLTGLLLGADASRLTRAELPYYTTGSGTSFSAPQVSGAVALILEANPSLTPKEVKELLVRTATPLAKYYNYEVGAGMLNTYAAVTNATY
jgi:serine protease AprX